MPQSDERMAWEVVPFEAIGPLRFGMTREEVATTLGETPKVSPPPQGIKPLPIITEWLDNEWAHAEYDLQGRLLAVESSKQPIAYRGISLLNRPAADVRADLERLGIGSQANDENNGFDVPELGVMLYVPGESDHEPPNTVLAVLAHSREYLRSELAPERRV